MRNGIPQGASPKTAGPDMIRAMTTDLWLDFLAIRMDAKKAEGMKFKINSATPDNGEKYVVELSNGALTSIEGYRAKDADLSITINRSDLEQVMMGAKTFDDQIAAGKAKLRGNKGVYDKLKSTLVQFELGFEMLPGTKAAPTQKKKRNPFEQEPPVLAGE